MIGELHTKKVKDSLEGFMVVRTILSVQETSAIFP